MIEPRKEAPKKPRRPGTFTGKTHSDEAKRKIGLAGLGRPAWNKGLKASDEFRKKLSEAHKGYVPTKEHRRHLSEAGKGRKHTEESRAKMSAALKGKPSWNK